MCKFTNAVVNDKKPVQCLKPNGLNREQITRPDLVAVLMTNEFAKLRFNLLAPSASRAV